MNDEFKTQLIANIEEASKAVIKLLETKGCSILEVTEVERDLVNDSVLYLESLERYMQDLMGIAPPRRLYRGPQFAYSRPITEYQRPK